jgi:hypothetical protein
MDKGRKVKIAFNGSLWMLLAVNTTLTRVTPSGLLGQPTFFPFLSWPRAKADLARACFSFFAVCVCRWRYAQLSFASPSLGQIKQMYQNRHRILF